MNNKLYEYFLSMYKYDEKNQVEFNFRFNKKYSINKYNEEFNKFIYFLDNFYYVNNKLVTSINSYEIIIPQKIIRHIIKLYVYSIEKGNKLQQNILGDFLITYLNTILINRGTNKTIKVDYKKVEKQYRKELLEFSIKPPYNHLRTECESFYLEAITYGIKNDLYISPEVINKILNNTTNKAQLNAIIEELLKVDNYYFIVINYDNNIINHKKSYLNFIKKILKQDYSLNNINDIFKCLMKNNALCKDEIKQIINLYIIRTNNICTKYKYKAKDSIGFLSETEQIRQRLLEVLNINTLDDCYKDKIHECLVNILSLKRFLLADSEYINSSMHEFKTLTKISNEKISTFIKEIETEKFKIYSASSVDFDKCAEDAVEYYSKYALQSIVSRYSVNTNTQTYLTNDIFSTNYKYNFEKYYEKIGQEYTKKNYKKLLNKKSDGLYVEMLRNLSRTFNLHQNITISILGSERFQKIIKEIKDELKYKSNNDYITIVKNILAIEVNIIQFLSKNAINYTDDSILNLDLIFEKYKENKIIRNGIMYLYYSLYEPTGPNLRNKAMHGTLINEDLKIPLLVSFSGLIFSSWLLNAKQL